MDSLYMGIIGVLVISGSMFHFSEINSKNNKIMELYSKLEQKEKIVKDLNDAIDEQNRIIVEYYNDRDKAIKEFEAYKKLPPKIKYKYIYKTVLKDINTKDERCENVNKVTNNIKSINLNKL